MIIAVCPANGTAPQNTSTTLTLARAKETR